MQGVKMSEVMQLLGEKDVIIFKLEQENLALKMQVNELTKEGEADATTDK